MKDKSNKLNGKTVMVNPQLTTDPADKRGKIGKVSSVINNSVAYVAFEDGTSAAYQLDGLLMMKSANAILQSIGNNVFSDETLSTVVKIIQLTEQNRYREALHLSVNSDDIAKTCVLDCQSWLDKANQKKQNKVNFKRPK